MTLLSSKRGFTLLEIIIAILILSFLMIGVYYLSDNSIVGVERVTAEDRQKVQIEAAMNRIDLDFTRIYNPLFHKPAQTGLDEDGRPKAPEDSEEEQLPPFEVNERFPLLSKSGEPIPALKSDNKSELVFLSYVNQRKVRNTKESHFAWVKYMLRTTEADDDSEKNTEAPYELIRYYSASDVYAPDFDFDNLRPAVLLRNIKSLEFKFWNSEKKKFVDSLKNLPNKNLLRALKVECIIHDNNKNEIIVDRIYRSLWPYFDPKKDEEAMKKKGGGSSKNKEDSTEEDSKESDEQN